jgi:c-di-GMP-binding flagellar brake protein YcgR
MKDRRLHARLSFTTEIWLGQDGIFTRTDERLSDLSVGGACIESKPGYAVGSVFNLRFKLSPAGNFITCTAIVRNTRGGRGLGVEFLDLSPEDRERIKSFIEQQLLSEALTRTRTALAQSGGARASLAQGS